MAAPALPAAQLLLIAYAFTTVFDLLVVARFPDAPSFPRDFGPSLAALIVTAAVAGKPGLRRLLERLVQWRGPVGWYLFVLLGIPALYVLGIVLVVPGAPRWRAGSLSAELPEDVAARVRSYRDVPRDEVQMVIDELVDI